MLNGRLYRAAFLPFAARAGDRRVLADGGRRRRCARRSRPTPSKARGRSPNCSSLAARFPDRRPGSPGDEALAALRRAARCAGSAAPPAGGFTVHTRHITRADDRRRATLTTVIAQRPGSTARAPIVILAHRDAAARGAARRAVGTAALLELARVFAARETQRTIVLVSTSGGSGGDAGAADFAAHRRRAHGPFDAAIVLGDLAGASRQRKPFVVPYSDGLGSAPLELQRTVDDAITHETGCDPGRAERARPARAPRVPARRRRAGPAQRRRGAGGARAGLAANAGPTRRRARRAPQRLRRARPRRAQRRRRARRRARRRHGACRPGSCSQRKTIPAWALRLLVGTLLLAAAARRSPTASRACAAAACRSARWRCGRSPARCRSSAARAVRVPARRARHASPPRPSAPVPAGALPFDGAGADGRARGVALVFALAWLLWPLLVRRLGLRRPCPTRTPRRGLPTVLRAARRSRCVVWIVNPFAALLLVPALHLWLLIASPELRPRPRRGARAGRARRSSRSRCSSPSTPHQLGLGPGQRRVEAVLLLAGGHVGLRARRCCGASRSAAPRPSSMLALRTAGAAARRGGPTSDVEITIRGPLSYAGPGSLGGTRVGSATIGAMPARRCPRFPLTPRLAARPELGSGAPLAWLASRALRALRASLLIVAGVLALADAGVTLVWQEPFSALYAKLRQDHLSGALAKVEAAPPTPPRSARSSSLADERRRIAFLAGGLAARSGQTAARSGSIRIPRDRRELRRRQGHRHLRSEERPGHLPRNDASRASPARPRSPGTARPTWRRSATSTRCAAAAASCSTCPTRTSPTRSSANASVAPTDVAAAVGNVGYTRLVLSACTPLFSAAKRLLVFARLTRTVPLGAARLLPAGHRWRSRSTTRCDPAPQAAATSGARIPRPATTSPRLSRTRAPGGPSPTSPIHVIPRAGPPHAPPARSRRSGGDAEAQLVVFAAGRAPAPRRDAQLGGDLGDAVCQRQPLGSSSAAHAARARRCARVGRRGRRRGRSSRARRPRQRASLAQARHRPRARAAAPARSRRGRRAPSSTASARRPRRACRSRRPDLPAARRRVRPGRSPRRPSRPP